MLFFVLFLLLKYSIRSSLESYVENLPYHDLLLAANNACNV